MNNKVNVPFTTEELDLLMAIMNDVDRNALPIAIEKDFKVSDYVRLLTKVEMAHSLAHSPD